MQHQPRGGRSASTFYRPRSESQRASGARGSGAAGPSADRPRPSSPAARGTGPSLKCGKPTLLVFQSRRRPQIALDHQSAARRRSGRRRGDISPRTRQRAALRGAPARAPRPPPLVYQKAPGASRCAWPHSRASRAGTHPLVLRRHAYGSASALSRRRHRPAEIEARAAPRDKGRRRARETRPDQSRRRQWPRTSFARFSRGRRRGRAAPRAATAPARGSPTSPRRAGGRTLPLGTAPGRRPSTATAACR